MCALTLRHVNHILRALGSEDGTTKYWTAHTTPELVQLLETHGLEFNSCAANIGLNDRPDFCSVFAVVDRAAADAAIRPFPTLLSTSS